MKKISSSQDDFLPPSSLKHGQDDYMRKSTRFTDQEMEHEFPMQGIINSNRYGNRTSQATHITATQSSINKQNVKPTQVLATPSTIKTHITRTPSTIQQSAPFNVSSNVNLENAPVFNTPSNIHPKQSSSSFIRVNTQPDVQDDVFQFEDEVWKDLDDEEIPSSQVQVGKGLFYGVVEDDDDEIDPTPPTKRFKVLF